MTRPPEIKQWYCGHWRQTVETALAAKRLPRRPKRYTSVFIQGPRILTYRADNGVTIATLTKKAEDFAARQGVPVEKVRLTYDGWLFVKGLEPDSQYNKRVNNHESLLRAMALYRKDRDAVKAWRAKRKAREEAAATRKAAKIAKIVEKEGLSPKAASEKLLTDRLAAKARQLAIRDLAEKLKSDLVVDAEVMGHVLNEALSEPEFVEKLTAIYNGRFAKDAA